MRVLVLHDVVPEGAPPDQLDVFDQAEVFRAALAADGHAVTIAPFRVGAPIPPADLVVNLVESVGGEGRLAHLPPAVFSGLGIPFTGTAAGPMALTCHKRLCKQVLAARGLRVPPDWPDGGPRYIVKSLWEHGSLGIDDDNVVDHADVPSTIERLRGRLGGEVVAETFVDGRELNVSLLETPAGPVVMPLAEIAFDLPPGKPRIVGYKAKWTDGSIEGQGTPRTFDVAGVDHDAIRALVTDVWRALDLRGYVRVDLRIDADGVPYVLEVNANPCLAPDAGFLAACARGGWSPAEVVRAIVGAART